MYPLVLIKSFGKEKGGDIINEILRVNGDIADCKAISFDSYNLTAYNLLISTRYYKTTLLLFECNDLNLIPKEVKNKIEGSIFYFDSNDINFVAELEHLVEFANDNHVGVATLITRNLSENSLSGVSYNEIKKMCKFDLNIVDLNTKSNNHKEAVGFAEVLELLKNHIWSTVQIAHHNSEQVCKLKDDEVNAEEALNEFEELLQKFHQFKDVSQNMCREEVLQNAEHLAQLFENILNED